MAHALPLTKVAGLLIKTVAKPVSKRIKHDFSRFAPTRSLLIYIGQLSHNVTSRMTIWSAGYRVRSITPLKEEEALQVGAEIIGESFLLGVSIGWLGYETIKSRETSKLKEEQVRAAAKAEREELQKKLRALDLRLGAVEKAVKSKQSNSLLNLGGKDRYVEPPEKDLVPIVDDEEGAADTTNEEVSDSSSGTVQQNSNSNDSSATSDGMEDKRSGAEPTSTEKRWWQWPPW